VPNSDAEFEKLIGEWRAGSADALAKLLNKHAGRVREAVRARLNDRLRAEYDSLDFVQDVWASLLAISSDRNDFESSDQFIGFLVRVAEFKVIEVTRR